MRKREGEKVAFHLHSPFKTGLGPICFPFHSELNDAGLSPKLLSSHVHHISEDAKREEERRVFMVSKWNFISRMLARELCSAALLWPRRSVPCQL